MQRKKMLIAVLAMALLLGIVSAATISYFGQIKVTTTVSQAVLVDGQSYADMPIEETANVAGGESFCRYHWLKSHTSVPVAIQFETTYSPALADAEIVTTYTTTITESSNYPDYFAAFQRLVALQVSGKTLSTLLGMTLEYTVNVTYCSTISPINNYAPNINIVMFSGITTKTVENWGGFTTLGLNTKTFEALMGESGGATVITGTDTTTRESFTTTSALVSSYGGWQVTMVEVRAQAGAAGGQKLRPTEFKAAGVTIAVPDSDTFTTLTLQPGELLPFYICYKFDLLIKAGIYTITTTVKPA